MRLLVAAVLLWALPLVAAAHELDFQQLQLIWDAQDVRLRGQVLVDPRLLDEQGDARADAVLRLVRENLDLEIDGKSCALHFEVRELWVPAGATLGDLVMTDCPTLSSEPRALRVFVGDGLHGLRVTVQRVERSGEVFTDNALVLAGTWSDRYFFAGGWGADAGTATEQTSGWALAWQYFRYGVDHILDEGWDHVAFVATLVLSATRAGFLGLFLRLSAFTVAHSITLGLGAAGWVVLPRTLIEPLISLSIAVLSLLQLVSWRSDKSKRGHWDLALPFAFGLLHGQGFASVLIDAGLPLSGFLVALFSFNVGVELGQALWASLFWLGALALPKRAAPRVLWLCALGLALLGLYWTWERTLG